MITQTEKSLFGILLVATTTEKLLQCIQQLQPEEFSSETHQIIYKSMIALWKKDVNIGIVEILNEAKNKSIDDNLLLECISKSSLSQDFNELIRIVKEASTLRKLKQLSEYIVNTVDQEQPTKSILADCQLMIDKLNGNISQGKVYTTTEVLNSWLESKSDNLESVGLQLGFDDFRELNVYLKNTHLITLAGRPKTGKSQLGIQIALNNRDKNVLFYSLEMHKHEVIDRMVANLAGISPTVVQNWGQKGFENSMDLNMEKFSWATNELSNSKIKIYDDDISIYEMITMSKIMNMKDKLDLIVVDQLSFIKIENKFGKQDKNEEYTFIIIALKKLAQQLDIPILLLCQLNRDIDKRVDGIPQLSDLKNSGSIEEGSDSILMISRKEHKDFASVFVTNRHGRCGTIDLTWNQTTASFENLSITIKKS